MLGILHKSAHHIASQSVVAGLIRHESIFIYLGWDIIHAPIEGAHPESAFLVACDAIYKSLGGTAARIVYLREHAPGMVLQVILHQSVVTSDEGKAPTVIIEFVDMFQHIGKRSTHQHFGSAIGHHLIESLVPGAHHDAAILQCHHCHTR